jgi:hypothetical protein
MLSFIFQLEYNGHEVIKIFADIGVSKKHYDEVKVLIINILQSLWDEAEKCNKDFLQLLGKKGSKMTQDLTKVFLDMLCPRQFHHLLSQGPATMRKVYLTNVLAGAKCESPNSVAQNYS